MFWIILMSSNCTLWCPQPSNTKWKITLKSIFKCGYLLSLGGETGTVLWRTLISLGHSNKTDLVLGGDGFCKYCPGSTSAWYEKSMLLKQSLRLLD